MILTFVLHPLSHFSEFSPLFTMLQQGEAVSHIRQYSFHFTDEETGLEKTGIRVLKVAETDALPLRWLPPLLHQAPPPLVVSCMNTIHTDCLNGSNWQRKELRGKNLPRS